MKSPIPDEVRTIFNKAARAQYRMMIRARWCVTCYRQRSMEGRPRCATCNETYLQQKRNKTGGQPWKAGSKGRPPKKDALRGEEGCI